VSRGKRLSGSTLAASVRKAGSVVRVMPLSEQRAGRNEALFRQVNENIADLEEHLDAVEGEPPFVCECANRDCIARLQNVDLALYEQTRRNPRRFFVAPGHQNEQVERVVETHPTFVIVEKTGEAGEVAEQTQP
jgi:hypothetical protein